MTMARVVATPIRTRMTMIADAAQCLRLQSWFSPAFPIGAFSYSHGLEWAVEEGSVTDRGSLVRWLEADLRHGSGRMDAMVFAQAWRAADARAPSAGDRVAASPLPDSQPLTRTTSTHLRERAATAPGEGEHPAKLIDGARNGTAQAPPNHERTLADGGDILALAALAAAMRGTAELALESGQQGTAFLSAVRKAWPHPELDRLARLLTNAAIPTVLPVAAGICCAAHGIGLERALPLYAHSSAANLVNAAARLVPLGQTDGQIALAALEPAVLEMAREALHAAPEDIGSGAFMIDLASMRHETQYTRLFRS